MDDPGNFLRVEQVSERTALSRSEIYKRVEGARFPKPIKLAARLTVWVESEVIAWQREQIESR